MVFPNIIEALILLGIAPRPIASRCSMVWSQKPLNFRRIQTPLQCLALGLVTAGGVLAGYPTREIEV